MDLEEIRKKLDQVKKREEERSAAERRARFERVFGFFEEAFKERENLLILLKMVREVYSLRNHEFTLPFVRVSEDKYSISASSFDERYRIDEEDELKLKVEGEGRKVFLVWYKGEKEEEVYRFELPRSIATLEQLFKLCYFDIQNKFIKGFLSDAREGVLRPALERLDEGERKEVVDFFKLICSDLYSFPAFDGSVESALHSMERAMKDITASPNERLDLKERPAVKRFLEGVAIACATNCLLDAFSDADAKWPADKRTPLVFKWLMWRCREVVKEIERLVDLLYNGTP